MDIGRLQFKKKINQKLLLQLFWQFRTMPFGLCNAPATFERRMEQILSGLNRDLRLVYLDDIIVTGKSFIEHIDNLKKAVSYTHLTLPTICSV